jgi:hypothetical protein
MRYRTLLGEGCGLHPAGLATSTGCTGTPGEDAERRGSVPPGAWRWLVTSPNGEMGGVPPLPNSGLQNRQQAKRWNHRTSSANA